MALTEVAIVVGLTRLDGWVQATLAIFVIVFPFSVATAFFWILWNRSYVLYAPRDFGHDTSVEEFVGTMRTATTPSISTIEGVVRAALESVVPRLADTAETSREATFDKALEVAREDFERRLVNVDISAFVESANGRPAILSVPVDESTEVQQLLNAVYYGGLSVTVQPGTYGHSWVLKSKSRVYSEMGMRWAKRNGRRGDSRRLNEVDIRPGSWLVAQPIGSRPRPTPLDT